MNPYLPNEIHLHTNEIQRIIKVRAGLTRNWTIYPASTIEQILSDRYRGQLYYHSFNPDTETATFKTALPEIPKVSRWTRFKQFLQGK